MIILSRNECPYPPSPRVIEYVEKYLNSINRYEAEGLVEELIDRVSKYVGIDESYIHLIPGSEAFFTTLPWYLVTRKYRFVYSSPTFVPAIEDLRVWGVELVDVPLNDDLMHDLEGIVREGGDSVLYIIRPNNPTGNITIECSDIAELADHYKLIIVDEAYYEFSKTSCKDLVRDYENIVVLRTFSKAFCIAGARLGYVIGSRRICETVFTPRRKYDIPIPSLAAGLGAISDIAYMEKVVEEILNTKEKIVEKLRRINGVKVIDTLTNFILVSKRGYDSQTLYQKLLSNGIIVKQLNGRMKDYVRVSIGRPSEMEEFIEVVKRI